MSRLSQTAAGCMKTGLLPKASLDFNAMRQAEIYKNLGNLEQEEYGALVEDLLTRLTTLYRQAALSNEAVLVWLD